MKSFKSQSPPFLPSWLAKDTDAKSDAIRSAVSHQLNLEDVVDQIEQLLDSRNSGPLMDSKDALVSLKSCTEGLRQFFSDLADPQFFNEKLTPTMDNSLAQKVFSVPEMLELILSFADMRGILNMMQVSKSILAQVQASNKLQQRLHLRPCPNSFFEIPSLLGGSPSILVYAKGVAAFRDASMETAYLYFHSDFQSHSSTQEEDSARVAVKLRSDPSGCLPSVGQTCQGMSVCEPPIKTMFPSLNCCGTQEFDFVSSERLTIGDLYTKAKELAKQHRLCQHAEPRLLDDDGFVRVVVRFYGWTKLRPDDPYLAKHKSKEETASAAPAQVVTERMERMEDYTSAKLHAAVRGKAIPTLAEFEAGDKRWWLERPSSVA